MKFLSTFCLFLGMLWSIVSHAELVAIEEAIEAHDIEVVIYRNGEGYVVAHSCAGCPGTRLDIDSKTTVTVDGKPASVNKRIEKTWPGGLVIYDVKTNHVVTLKL